jgi:hypothetical protein
MTIPPNSHGPMPTMSEAEVQTAATERATVLVDSMPLDQLVIALRAALPDMVLVPREPTPEMIIAATSIDDANETVEAIDIYRAMIDQFEKAMADGRVQGQRVELNR